MSVGDVRPGAVVWVTHSPPGCCRGLEALGRGQGSPSGPTPTLCKCAVCWLRGNWAGAQGELTVCANSSWGWGAAKERR